jgi:hypothetical protein
MGKFFAARADKPEKKVMKRWKSCIAAVKASQSSGG